MIYRFIFILIINLPILLFSQATSKKSSFNNFSLGKVSICDNKFLSFLKERNFIKDDFSPNRDFYAIGYIKNIDFYYISYSESSDFDYVPIIEFYKMDSSTHISSFSYTSYNVGQDDPNINHFVFSDIGMVDSFDDYLIVYNEEHINIYKRNKSINKYDLITEFKCSKSYENYLSCSLIYNKSKREFLRKLYGISGYKKGYFETYKIINGDIIKIK